MTSTCRGWRGWAHRASSTGTSAPPFSGVWPALGVEVGVTRWATLGGSGRYIGTARTVDNTGDESMTTPDFFMLDGSAWIELGRLLPFVAGASPRLRIQVDNVLDTHRGFRQATATSTSSATAPAPTHSSARAYYYPLATRTGRSSCSTSRSDARPWTVSRSLASSPGSWPSG